MSPSNQDRREVGPVAVIYAGCNGAGKSTLRRIEESKGLEPRLPAIDPDMLARRIAPAAPRQADIAAAKKALLDTGHAIGSQMSFSLETTLTGRGVFRRIEFAQNNGFWIRLIYVGLASAEIAVERVAARVLRGGHHIDEAVVRRRYAESLRSLPKAILLADEVAVFDNSDVFQEHFRKRNGQFDRVSAEPLPPQFADLEQRVSDLVGATS